MNINNYITTPENFIFEDETEMERFSRSEITFDLEDFLDLWNEDCMENLIKEIYEKMDDLQSEEEKLLQEKVKVELSAIELDQQSI